MTLPRVSASSTPLGTDRPLNILMRNSDPWFVTTDLACKLDYRDAHTMARNLRDQQKGTHSVCTLGGQQELLIVSEGGMWRAVMRSRRPEADRFQEWVEEEVLPSIRRTGSYSLPVNDDGAASPLPDGEWTPRDKIAWVRTMLHLRGRGAALDVARILQLPMPDNAAAALADPDLERRAREWLAGRAEFRNLDELAAATGCADRRLLGDLARALGWHSKTVRRGDRIVKRWVPARSGEA